jgi:hypothetical protein
MYEEIRRTHDDGQGAAAGQAPLMTWLISLEISDEDYESPPGLCTGPTDLVKGQIAATALNTERALIPRGTSEKESFCCVVLHRRMWCGVPQPFVSDAFVTG